MMEQRTLQLIEIPRIPSARPRKPRKITGRQYQRALRKAYFMNLILLCIIIVLSVALYIAQAGPM